MRNLKIFLLLCASVMAGTLGAELVIRLAGGPEPRAPLSPERPAEQPGSAEESSQAEARQAQARASDN